MGYINYEACLEMLGLTVVPSCHKSGTSFVFVEHSILIEHRSQLVHIQSLDTDESSSEASQRLYEVTAPLDVVSRQQSQSMSKTKPLSESVLQSTLRVELEHRTEIAEHQELIDEGESYELCLTDQARFRWQPERHLGNMYSELCRLDPAPFVSYVRRGALTVLSTSLLLQSDS